MAGQKRTAGNVSINGVPYVVLKDADGNFVYQRKSAPKKAQNSTRRNAETGESNMIAVRWDFSDGFGDVGSSDDRDTLQYTLNLFTERAGEAVALPAILTLEPDDNADAVIADIQLCWSAPVFVWEQIDDDGNDGREVQTFFLADHRAFTFRERTGLTIGLDEDMFFESYTRPTGGTTFNNFAYAAMGGGQDTKDRYIRRREPTTGTWTNDDFNLVAITAVANSGSGTARYTTGTAHGYAVGDVVFVIVTTGATAHAGLWTITTVSDTTHFDVAADTNTSTMTGTVNVQDSDVKAQQLCIVGDEMVRTFYDTTSGWQTSRVDIVGSNELLVSNWTAGIGTLNVGDSESAPTALIPFGDGELVGKPEGLYRYSEDTALMENEIPELASHRHPNNCKGMSEYKGWVYIPTIIGLLRWKNGILQDVTPGRGATQDFDTPIGPIAAIVGDANRMYAITQPFQLNQPQVAADTIKAFGYNLTANTPVTANTDVFDGTQDTYVVLTALETGGGLYFGCSEKFHRIHLQINQFANQVTNGSRVTVEIWNGSAWVTKTVLYDGTRGWQNTDNDPTALYQTGDIVFGPMGDPDSGEDDWDDNANTYDTALTAGLYWARVKVTANAGGSNATWLEEVDFGIHVNTAFEPYHTQEIANDHGGIIYVLTMTEEQGRGVVWRILWALAAPDVTRTSGIVYGGPQQVGAAGIVQPGFLRAHMTGDRYLFIGTQNINYLCPLGNHPDPTGQPHLQFKPYTDEGFEAGFRPIVIVTPYTDFGLPTETKTLSEIEFETEGVDLSSVEVWYSVDHGAWVFVGYADDLTPNMPIVLPEGSEPSGKEFAVALSYDADAERPIRLDRFGPITLRAQPRPAMSETISLTLELEPDQQMPGGVKRVAAHNAYAALKALEGGTTTVTFTNISGQTERVQVLQVGQRAKHNAGNRPTLYADVVLKVGTTRTEAA